MRNILLSSLLTIGIVCASDDVQGARDNNVELYRVLITAYKELTGLNMADPNGDSSTQKVMGALTAQGASGKLSPNIRAVLYEGERLFNAPLIQHSLHRLYLDEDNMGDAQGGSSSSTAAAVQQVKSEDAIMTQMAQFLERHPELVAQREIREISDQDIAFVFDTLQTLTMAIPEFHGLPAQEQCQHLKQAIGNDNGRDENHLLARILRTLV